MLHSILSSFEQITKKDYSEFDTPDIFGYFDNMDKENIHGITEQNIDNDKYKTMPKEKLDERLRKLFE